MTKTTQGGQLPGSAVFMLQGGHDSRLHYAYIDPFDLQGIYIVCTVNNLVHTVCLCLMDRNTMHPGVLMNVFS